MTTQNQSMLNQLNEITIQVCTDLRTQTENKVTNNITNSNIIGIVEILAKQYGITKSNFNQEQSRFVASVIDNFNWK